MTAALETASWAERKSHSIVMDSSSVLAAQVFTLLAGVLSNFLIASLGGPYGKGIIYTMQLFSSAALVMANFGLGPAAVFLFRHEEKCSVEEMANVLLWPSLLLGCVPVLMLGLSRTGPMHLSGWSGPLLLAFAAVPAYTLVWNLSYFYLATGEIIPYNLLRASQSCLFAVLLCGLRFSHVTELRWLTASWIAGVCLPAVFALFVLAGTVNVWKFPRARFLQQAFSFGWRSHFGAVLQYMQHRTDVVLIMWLLSVRDLGVYSLAIGIVELLWYVPQAVSQVLLPHIADSTEADANRITSAFCRASIAVTALLSVTLATLSTLVIPRLLPGFREAIPVIWILLPGTVIASIFKVLASDLNGRGQPFKTVLPAVAALGFSLLGCWWAIPRFGMTGAATVTSLSYFLNAGLYLHRYSRLSDISVRSLVLLKTSDLAWYRGLLLGRRVDS
jgi:O-antigen/teichoic acid export membrane protein